jgi:hypothetical protein
MKLSEGISIAVIGLMGGVVGSIVQLQAFSAQKDIEVYKQEEPAKRKLYESLSDDLYSLMEAGKYKIFQKHEFDSNNIDLKELLKANSLCFENKTKVELISVKLLAYDEKSMDKSILSPLDNICSVKPFIKSNPLNDMASFEEDYTKFIRHYLGEIHEKVFVKNP